MLSRGTSNTSRRPQRTKSAPLLRHRAAVSVGASVFDPEIVHQDALTAANLAYERANQHQALQKGTSRVGREQEPGQDIVNHPELGRRQSVRFVGPSAVPRRTRSITRREAPGYSASHQTHGHSFTSRPMDLSPYSDDLSVRASPGEFNENFIASEPSSYRKLRKAKSMFSPGKAPSTLIADRTPNSKRHFQRHSRQSSGCNSDPIRVPDPRLKRSYSFLRGVADRISIPDRSSTGNRQYATNDAAIQLARDTYLRQLEEQRLKEQPSFLGLGKRQKTQRAFRRTVRTGSTNSYGSAISSPLSSFEPTKPTGLSSKARTLSQTWREKIKRVFKRSSNDGGTIPAQHVDASQPHYGNGSSASNIPGHKFAPLPEPDTELLHRVNSRESSLSNEPVYGSKTSRPGSIRSVNDDDEDIHDKSRVTSWTNSTAANTIKMPLFMTRKRLSVITEDGGPHQSSSSARNYKDTEDVYANFRQPIKQGGAGQLETQRIFSALQKQIDENNRRAALEESEADIDRASCQETDNQSLSIPRRRSSSRSSVRGSKTVPDTNPEDGGMDVMECDPFDAFTKFDNRLRQVSTKGHYNPYQQHSVGSSEGLTPQQIAQVNEFGPLLSKRPLREVKSAFFPPSIRIERGNTSPYRRAMYANGGNEDAMIRCDFADQRATLSGRSVAGSESVYSRSSGGYDPQPSRSTVSLAKSEDDGEAGTAVIITSHSLGPEPSARHSFPRRHSSAKSSGDWKSSMASQVATLENDGRSRYQVVDDSPAKVVKGSRHKREHAQLDDDDVEIGFFKGLESGPKQPLGIIQGNAIRQPRSSVGRTSSVGRYSTSQSTSQNKENSPVQSASMSSQKYSTVMNENRLRDFRKDTINRVSQKTSQASLVSQVDNERNSVTRSPRYSPERAERLRRLKSSSTTTLRPTPSPNVPHTAHSPMTNSEQESQFSVDSDGSNNILRPQAGMNTKLVNSFLEGRRREMRISEESSPDPAFL